MISKLNSHMCPVASVSDPTLEALQSSGVWFWGQAVLGLCPQFTTSYFRVLSMVI